LTLTGRAENNVAGASYGDLCAILDKISRNAAAGKVDLYRRMVFNILIRNTDDHLRNHGFLFTELGYDLSPAFDVTPTLYTPGISTSPRLALGVGAMGVEGTLENALSEVEVFGLDDAAAQEIIGRMALVFSNWRIHFEQSGVSRADILRLSGTFDAAQQLLQAHSKRVVVDAFQIENARKRTGKITRPR